MPTYAAVIWLLFVTAGAFASVPNVAASDAGSARERIAAMASPPAESQVPGPAEDLSQQAKLDRVIDRIAARFNRPERVRRHLNAHLKLAVTCFADKATEEQLEAIMTEYLMRPPGSFDPEHADRFFTEAAGGRVWVDDGLQGLPGQGKKARLTYSFPADQPAGGTTLWGLSGSGFMPAPNQLNAALAFVFGEDPDRGREFLRQSLAAWRKYGGITYDEVGDDNASMSGGTTRVSVRGDIRIGGIPLGVNGVLAYNGFPSTLGGALLGGGDMCLNTSYFTDVPSNTFYRNASNDYRYLRNTVSHEHGHGLGYYHAVPCNQTKIMEPTITSTPIALSIDERRSVAYNYGDRFAGNQGSATAHDFGNLNSPVDRSVLEPDLALNRVAAPNQTQDDWFKFTLTATRTITLTATPTGGSYQNDLQSSGCTGVNGTPVPTINASSAGNIQLGLYNNLASLIEQAPETGAGNAETITRSLAPGTYLVLVRNTGNVNPSETDPNITTQLYDLSIRNGSNPAPPWAIAGINKRTAANTPVYFNGVPNSQPVEPGTSIFPTAYEWDLDGDGVFEVPANPRPSLPDGYPSNGVFNVSLRVTDSNGMQDIDTIKVTVFGAPTLFTALVPNSGAKGASVPMTVHGTNLRNVTSASQFVITGTGVTFSGTPVPNALGTEVTGVIVNIAAGATIGTRSITILNTDGMDAALQAVNAFTIINAAAPANDECAGATSWGNTAGAKNFSTANASTSANQTFPATGCPSSGPISGDVWHSWTAPISAKLTATYTGTFAIRLAIYQGTVCPPGNPIACDDFGAAVNTNVVAGQTYLFRVGASSPGFTGTGTVTLALDPTGACCSGGNCTITIEDLCSGTWTEGVAACTPATCCAGDLTGDGLADLADLVQFLNAWSPQIGLSGPGLAGDFNGDQIVDLADLISFLTAWQTGC